MDSEIIGFLFLDRIPLLLPSLKVYSVLTIVGTLCSLYHFWVASLRSAPLKVSDLQTSFSAEISLAARMEHYHLLDEAIFNSNFELNRRIYRGPSSPPEHFVTDNRNVTFSHAGFNGEWVNFSGRTNVGDGEGVVVLNDEYAGSNGGSEFDGDAFGWQTIHWASQQPHCVWPLVNLAYCLLILLGHSVQKTVFGNLRVSEQDNVKEQFWNLVFYKVVFVFGVVNAQEVEDAVGWCFFVSVIGFLQLARQLCQERHNYLIMTNDSTPKGESRRDRILALLCIIFVASIVLFLAVGGWYFGSSSLSSEYPDPFEFNLKYERATSNVVSSSPTSRSGTPSYDFNLGLHSAIFMLCELGLLTIQTLHALIICIFDQVRIKCLKGRQMSEDTYSHISQSINFKFDLVALLFDLMHHVHMLICCNLFLSMTSLVVSLQMRTRVRQIHGILKKRQSYIWLSEHIDQYPDAMITPAACEDDDENCAICWDPLTSQKSKSLPCQHMFHTSCLRKWLLVSMNCPKCRLTLVNEKEAHYCSMERQPRRVYGPRPVGLWGFLQTGQALLDLFGGWDPQFDEVTDEAPPLPRPVPLYSNFGVRDWTVSAAPNAPVGNIAPSSEPETRKA